jgi:hypothetical protein
MFFIKLINKLKISKSNLNWIDLLRPIIKDFKSDKNEPLNHSEVERLSMIIRFKIDLEEGNISDEELEYVKKESPTFH